MAQQQMDGKGGEYEDQFSQQQSGPEGGDSGTTSETASPAHLAMTTSNNVKPTVSLRMGCLSRPKGT